MSDFHDIGGEPALRAIVREFIDRVSADRIIGFFFQGKDLERVADREYQLVAERMGGPVAYGGRPLGRVHQPLGINKGHLRRRLVILRHVLDTRGVAPAIAERWVRDERGLEEQITNRRECVE